MLRVDQAGEYGATRIYAGQLAVLGDRHPMRALIAGDGGAGGGASWLLRRGCSPRRGVRPTLLQPFWTAAGHALGAATALIGPDAAMACTAAIEDEIDAHYAEQLDRRSAKTIRRFGDAIARFQADEREHRDTAIAAGAEATLGYPLIYAAIRAGCRAAIALSKRI